MEKVLGFKSQVILGAATPRPGCFTVAQSYVPPGEETLKKRGKLFVVATLKGPTHFAVEAAGQLVLDALQAEYFSLLEGSPLPALEKAVSAAHRRLLDLLHGPSLANKEGVDFNLVAAVLWGQILYLAKLGLAAVYLLREGTLAEIGTAAETQVSVASGLVEDKDVLILGSASFREQFPPDILQNNLENLEDLMRKKEKREGLVALVVSLFWEEAVAEKEVVAFVTWPPPRPAEPPPPRGLYLERHTVAERRQRRQRYWAGFFLLVFLLFLVVTLFTLQRARQRRVLRELTLLQAAVEQKVLAASDFLDLNNQKAREILSEALFSAEKISSLGDEAGGEDWRQRIEALLVKVNKVQVNLQVALVYDFAVQGKESRPVALAGGGGFLYVADPGTGTLYQLELGAAQPKVTQMGAGELARVEKIVGGEDYLYGIAADGLFRVALPRQTVRSGLAEATAAATTALAYYNSNLYLLRARENLFVRYTPTAPGVSSPTKWLKEEAKISDAVSLSVDGDVYFLFKDGRVRKFTAGKATDFKLVNLDKPFGEALIIYTRADLSELYVLDGGGQRLVLFDKNGFYRRQIPLTNKMFAAPSAFWVSATGKVIYLLDGTRLLSVEIQDSL